MCLAIRCQGLPGRKAPSSARPQASQNSREPRSKNQPAVTEQSHPRRARGCWGKQVVAASAWVLALALCVAFPV